MSSYGWVQDLAIDHKLNKYRNFSIALYEDVKNTLEDYEGVLVISKRGAIRSNYNGYLLCVSGSYIYFETNEYVNFHKNIFLVKSDFIEIPKKSIPVLI